jgi:hypothetical protein
MTDSRAQRLIDEFVSEAECPTEGIRIRRGLAAVLRHLADTEAGYADEESWYAVPAATLCALADALTAPSLLDRALAGDAKAARRFLYEQGFTDADGQLLPHFQPLEKNCD